MIKYRSTRIGEASLTFKQALLQGIANNGGLFVPEKIPGVSKAELQKLVGSFYHETALFVLKKFEPDISEDLLKKLAKKAYSNNFDDSSITPVVNLKNNQYIQELWHGPTASFKDMALQLTSLIFSEVVKIDNKKTKENKKYLILTATSGDTGKAVLDGFKKKGNITVFVLFPDKKVSSIQELSMTTQEGNNLKIASVSGNFDDTQRLVKAIFNDNIFNQEIFAKYNYKLSAANSINWGRLLPQIIYYFFGYLNLVNGNIIKFGDKINFAVPSGNGGNICAGLIAKMMGLPINKLICSSNENNILSDFFKNGVFDLAKRKMVETPSPAMDILIPSNLERILYFLVKNKSKIKQWMKDLKTEKRFSVDLETKKRITELFISDSVSNYDTLKNIKIIFDETGYIMDPHTSVAQYVIEKLSLKEPTIVLSTAHWSKFPESISKSLFADKNYSNTFETINRIKNYTKSHIPKSISELRTKKIIHTKKIGADKHLIEKEIINFVK